MAKIVISPVTTDMDRLHEVYSTLREYGFVIERNFPNGTVHGDLADETFLLIKESFKDVVVISKNHRTDMIFS